MSALFDIAVPPALHGVARARHLLARIGDEGRDELLGVRLTPDMFDCAAQMRMVSIMALRATYPVIGQDWPREITQDRYVADLSGLDEGMVLVEAQIAKLTPADFEGSAERIVTHRAGFADLRQPGLDYVTRFALPNMWFHLSMAYAILRSVGMELGKADFDGLHAYPAGFRFEG